MTAHDDDATTPPPAEPAPDDTRRRSLPPADASALVDPWPHFPDAIRARYARGAVLGRGGMGVVYQATDTVLGRKVATKGPISLAGERNELLRIYTARELRLMAKLGHPNILPGDDLGCAKRSSQRPDGRNEWLGFRWVKDR